MALFGFGGKTKNKTFSYTPLYYDPVKEKLDNILGRDNPNLSEEEQMKQRIIYNMRKRAGVKPQESVSDRRRNSNIRLFAIIILLTAVTYSLLLSDTILNFVQQMSK